MRRGDIEHAAHRSVVDGWALPCGRHQLGNLADAVESVAFHARVREGVLRVPACPHPQAYVRFHGMRGSRLHTRADLFRGGHADHLPAGARLTGPMASACEANLFSKCTALRSAQTWKATCGARPCKQARVACTMCALWTADGYAQNREACKGSRRIASSNAPLSCLYRPVRINFEGEGEAGRSAQADRDARRTRSGAVEERARSLTRSMLVTVAGNVSGSAAS